MNWLASNWQNVLLIVTSTISGAAVTLRLLAPLTRNTTDDRIATWLERAERVLKRLALQRP